MKVLIRVFLTSMIKKQKCPVCGEKFKPRTDQHIYCCRKHFKIAYREKMKEEANKMPHFLCPRCGTDTVLTFKPKEEPSKWISFKCPNCIYSNSERVLAD